MVENTKVLYEERLKRVNDAQELREPGRIPIAPQTGFISDPVWRVFDGEDYV